MFRRFLFPSLASVLAGLFVLVALTGRVVPADEVPPALKAKVKQFVSLLDDAEPAKREAAAQALLQLGPDILPVLTAPDQKLTATQKEAVADLVKKLRARQGDNPITAKTATIQDSLPLDKALAELGRQTGNTVEDRRSKKDDTRLGLDISKMTFWQALELIARDADARIDFYQKDGVLALVDGPYREPVAVSYDGIFRVEVKRISATRDLAADAHFYEVSLEVAWEPKFTPFFVEPRPDSLIIQDDKKHDILPVGQQGSGRVPVEGRIATLDLRLPAVQRSVNTLALLKGKLALLGPSEWLTFTFDDLKVAQQTQKGVTAKLSKVNLTPDLWTVEMTLDYPATGPSFESFEAWLVYNEIYLVKKYAAPEQKIANNGGYETGNSSGTRASISYHWVDEPGKKFTRGKPDDWKVVYKTPGQFVETPVPFEFKDLPLP
jgi:hypothetical protein